MCCSCLLVLGLYEDTVVANVALLSGTVTARANRVPLLEGVIGGEGRIGRVEFDGRSREAVFC